MRGLARVITVVALLLGGCSSSARIGRTASTVSSSVDPNELPDVPLALRGLSAAFEATTPYAESTEGRVSLTDCPLVSVDDLAAAVPAELTLAGGSLEQARVMLDAATGAKNVLCSFAFDSVKASISAWPAPVEPFTDAFFSSTYLWGPDGRNPELIEVGKATGEGLGATIHTDCWYDRPYSSVSGNFIDLKCLSIWISEGLMVVLVISHREKLSATTTQGEPPPFGPDLATAWLRNVVVSVVRGLGAVTSERIHVNK